MDQSAQQPPAVPSNQPVQPQTDQLVALQQKVAKAALPPELLESVNGKLNRLMTLRSSTGLMSSTYIIELEATVAYINWVTGLPWNTKTTDILDLQKAKQVLEKNHYGLASVKDRMLEYMASIILNLKNNPNHEIGRAPIMCLVGLAGTGKTTLAASVAEALGRKFERIPFGGISDARVLRGQSRAYADAEPGTIIKKLAHAGAKNCVILLDELDRVSVEARGDIMGVLIELLDPEQNKAYTDHYVDYPFDLSGVLFIATANNTTNVATAVLDRLEVIQMPSYNDEEKVTIAKSYLFPKIRSNSGLKQEQLVVDDTLWPSIIRPLGFDSGIRSLERTIEGMCRKVARLIVEGKVQSVHIQGENLRDFLPSL